ncbi:hypothetical protein FB45DRAFT_449028 [Roridomyces roridus]|uniref:Uncharacterized protein n=1 Tax=Roridomyces roridus TaxID=1738132 RepID=A0AAD7C1N0_9AGAR|nr:hypothetical protein FB45DRAFT_449028 [Roridomyces roridus]
MVGLQTYPAAAANATSNSDTATLFLSLIPALRRDEAVTGHHRRHAPLRACHLRWFLDICQRNIRTVLRRQHCVLRARTETTFVARPNSRLSANEAGETMACRFSRVAYRGWFTWLRIRSIPPDGDPPKSAVDDLESLQSTPESRGTSIAELGASLNEHHESKVEGIPLVDQNLAWRMYDARTEMV